MHELCLVYCMGDITISDFNEGRETDLQLDKPYIKYLLTSTCSFDLYNFDQILVMFKMIHPSQKTGRVYLYVLLKHEK